MIQMTPEDYQKEEKLHEILENNPQLVFSDYPELRNYELLLLKSQAPTYEDENAIYATKLDLLFVDREGTLTFVEVKLSSNPEIRREVVGQALEYAGNAIENWEIDEIKEMFKTSCRKKGWNIDERLSKFLTPEVNPDDFWDSVETKLRAGNVRIVIASDSIPSSLKNIIQFLRNQMKTAIFLGVDVPQFNNGNQIVFVPKVHGQLVTINPPEKKKWEESDFFAALGASTTPEIVSIAKKILLWSDTQHLEPWYGTGSFYPLLKHKGKQYQVIAIRVPGKIVLQFQFMKDYPPYEPEEKRSEFVKKINTICGNQLSPDNLTGRPSFSLDCLKDEAKYNEFIKIMDEFLDTMREL